MDATGNWPALRARLESHHLGHMQNQRLAELALREVESAMKRLAALGHVFHLEPGPALAPEWPKEMYKSGQPPREVQCQAELDELGDGWFDSQSAAEHARGNAIQFMGRGGVKGRNLPALIYSWQGAHQNGH